MTYVSGGDVVAKRSPWRLSIVTDMFWGVINFVGLLYVALVLCCLLAVDPSTATRPNSNIGQGSTSSRGLGGNGRGGPRRMGGVNHRGTINQPSTLVQ
ncbi:Selenoprotein SelK/SelG [Phytophthora cactorum]|nr:Selenoprotein SelK/SelG [Phytophthora cactorum]